MAGVRAPRNVPPAHNPQPGARAQPMLKHASRPGLLVHTESESFATDLRAQLEKEGVAIVPNVITHDECDRKAAKLAEGAGTVYPDGVAPHEKPIPGSKGCGIIKQYGAMLTNKAWECRLTPAVQEVYAKLYGTQPEDLVLSPDGFAVVYAKQSVNKNIPKSCSNVSGRERAKRVLRSTLPIHQDVCRGGNVHKCEQMMTQLRCEFDRVVQGALNFVSGSSAPITPSFAYVPRTSDDDEYRKTVRNKDMYCYTDEEVDEMLPRLQVVTVHKGDLILWLSSTPHCNVGATTVPDNVASHDLVRAVSFICWAPRVTQADGVGDAKARYAYEQGGSCNHVPNALSKGGSGKHFSDRSGFKPYVPKNENCDMPAEAYESMGASRKRDGENGGGVDEGVCKRRAVARDSHSGE